jgi:hypothetical protein
MKQQEDFSKLLADKLRAAHEPLVADEALWQDIAAKVTTQSKRRAWPWYGLAASLAVIAFWTYLGANPAQNMSGHTPPIALISLDAELQHLLLTEPDSAEVALLLEKRKALQINLPGSIEL